LQCFVTIHTFLGAIAGFPELLSMLGLERGDCLLASMPAPTTVLLAEDDENDLLLLQHALSKSGSTIPFSIVRDGNDAISYLQGSGQYADRNRFPLPRMILLDLKMPKCSGFEVLQWIRAHAALRRLVVIILTTSDERPDIDRGYELGANCYLVKPASIEGLLELVKTVHGYWLSLNQMPDLSGAAREV
jgi:CheY-like chemotaxis protein